MAIPGYVDPEEDLNFGDVVIGSQDLTEVIISNPGGAPIYVYDVFLEDQNSGFIMMNSSIFPLCF